MRYQPNIVKMSTSSRVCRKYFKFKTRFEDGDGMMCTETNCSCCSQELLTSQKVVNYVKLKDTKN